MLQILLKNKMAWAQASGPHHDVVLSSRVRLARNLQGYPFPWRASSPALKAVLSKVLAAARKSPLKDAAVLELDGLDSVDHALLIERHLMSPALAAEPAQRAVIVDGPESLSLMVNEEDHIRLSSLQPGLSLRQAYREAEGLDEALEHSLDLAFRSELGYLTACPTNLGTAMRASCLMHLPGLGLTGKVQTLLENLPRYGLTARGLYGEGTKVIGDFFQISNATALGRTEAELLMAVEKAATQLAAAELEARRNLASGPRRTQVEDIVHRAVGLLRSARLLSFEEAAHHLSALRVGLSLGWEVPGDIGLVNELSILVQPAHLMTAAGKPLSPEEQSAARAALVRQRLQG